MRKAAALLLAGVLTASLAGCGSGVSTSAEVKTAASAAAEQQTYASYDDIIGGLTAGEGYAEVELTTAEHPILFVASETYDGDGKVTPFAIDATMYAYDMNGNIIEYGKVMSQGTAYPISTDGSYIYSGGHHIVDQCFISEEYGSVMTHEEATESFDEKGNASYGWFSLEDEYEGPVEDDSHLTALIDKYINEATPIVFTVVK